MANTVIALKKSATPGSVPPSLEYGELGINYADGKLFYKNTNAQISEISSGGGNYFATVNANGTLIIADTTGDVISLVAGDNITIQGDAINDSVIISATSGGGGGGAYDGNNGQVNYPTGLGDIFRVHTNLLTTNVTIYSGNNALCAGPIEIQAGKALTIETNARVAIV